MEAERRIRMVVASTKRDPTGHFPQFTPKILRKVAREPQGKIYLYLNFGSSVKDIVGEVTNFSYDEDREELMAEATIFAEIPEGHLPAIGYMWDPTKKEIVGLTKIGLVPEPADPNTKFIETNDST